MALSKPDGAAGALATVDRALESVLRAGRWLVLPISLALFAQWPLRDGLQAGSREINDIGQWLFALYVSLALTYATRHGSHLAVGAIARAYPPGLRHALARFGGLVLVAPWAAFLAWVSWPAAQRSVLQLEAFGETGNPGYFLIKAATLLLGLLALLQALLDAARPARAD